MHSQRKADDATKRDEGAPAIALCRTPAKLDLEWTDLHAPQLLFTQVISYCMELLQAKTVLDETRAHADPEQACMTTEESNG